MLDSSLLIEPIAKHHRALLKDFKNQHESLVDYLRRFAVRHAERDLIGGTFLALAQDENENQRVAGYFSITTASLERGLVEDMEGVEALSKLPRFPIPGILLTRLAIDERLQGQGLGTYLLEEVFERVLDVLESKLLTFRVLLTDAIDEQAATFYEHFGFVRLADEFPARMVLDLKKLLEQRKA